MSPTDYVGLHQRYASLLEGQPLDFIAGRKEEEDKLRAELSRLFDGMMETLYKQEGANLNITILETPKTQEFIEAHAGALDSSFKQVEMSDLMRRRLERSNYIFSGMKTFHELNEAFPSLLDENGNRKPFEQFLNDVRKIDETYNSNYLRAEYNFIQASAQMAGKWERFMEDGDRYNLQYRTVCDNKVRPEHAALHGVTLPITDSFWEEFYPPNGWGCRCTVVQVRKSKYAVTDHEEAMSLGELATGKDTKGIFRFNPGKQEKAMPDYNPYTIRRCKDCDIAKGKLKLAFVPDNELCAACEILRTCYDQKRTAAFKEYRKSMESQAEHLTESHNNLFTKNFYQTKKSFKRGIGHARNIEEAEMFVEINQHISELRPIRISLLGEGKDLSDPKDIANLQRKRDRGVTAYHIYEFEFGGDTWVIKTEIYKNRSEAVYALYKKE